MPSWGTFVPSLGTPLRDLQPISCPYRSDASLVDLFQLPSPSALLASYPGVPSPQKASSLDKSSVRQVPFHGRCLDHRRLCILNPPNGRIPLWGLCLLHFSCHWKMFQPASWLKSSPGWKQTGGKHQFLYVCLCSKGPVKGSEEFSCQTSVWWEH